MRKGYGGGVPLYSNCHYAFRNWHEYSGGKLTDWGAHHVDIACWAIGASDTGPSKVTPLEYKLACEYRDGYPVVHDRYNIATNFKIRADMPNDVELIITSEGDNGILFEGTEGRFFVNRGKISGKPVEDLKDNPLPEGAIEEVYGGKVSGRLRGGQIWFSVFSPSSFAAFMTIRRYSEASRTAAARPVGFLIAMAKIWFAKASGADVCILS